MICFNKNNKEYKQLKEETGLTHFELGTILKFMESPFDDSFPTSDEILRTLAKKSPVQFIVPDKPNNNKEEISKTNGEFDSMFPEYIDMQEEDKQLLMELIGSGELQITCSI